MANELALYNSTDESVVVYQSEDGTLQLDVQLSDETVWLTQQQMSLLFNKRVVILRYILATFSASKSWIKIQYVRNPY